MKVGIVLLFCIALPCGALPTLAQEATAVSPSTVATGGSVVTATSRDPVDWPQVGMGFSTAVGNLFYIPAKIAYGTLGGLAGGAAYVFTRGDHDVAHKIWRNSLGGDYVLTSTMLKGQEPIHFVGSSQDDTQVEDTSRRSGRLVQPFLPGSERSVNTGVIGKRSDPSGVAAEHGSSVSLEIPRADRTSAPAELNPQSIRSGLSNQESIPQFRIVPQ